MALVPLFSHCPLWNALFHPAWFQANILLSHVYNYYKFRFFKLFILVLIACVCVWLCGDMCTHECGCSQYPEEDIISPGSRIESGCKVHDINVGK